MSEEPDSTYEHERYRFNGFVLDIQKKQLLYEGKGGSRENRTPRAQAFDLIAYLVRNCSKAVKKHQLYVAIWKPGRTTEEGYNAQGVDQALFDARRALWDTPQKSLYITSPRPGYLQFIYPNVIEELAPASMADKETPPAPTHISHASTGDQYARLLQTCEPDERTRNLMRLCGATTRMAVDGCFEVCGSPEYRGWTEEDIELKILRKAVVLPEDLQAIVNRFHPEDNHGRPAYNNGKYILRGLLKWSTEEPKLRMCLGRSDYYHTKAIQNRIYDPVLKYGNKRSRCTPLEKYGTPLIVGKSEIPSLVCLNGIIVLGDHRLLLTQRVTQKDNPDMDWEYGKWSVSFEEQMSSGKGLPGFGVASRESPRVDRSLVDALRAGALEELGDSTSSDHKILSVVLESSVACLNVLGIMRTHLSLQDVQAKWDLNARDGKKELKRVAAINWDVETLAPILAGIPVVVPSMHWADDHQVIRREDWNVTGRMRILVSLFHKFGVDETLARFSEWSTLHQEPL